ncbi:MAG: cysteine synthase A [Clostridia bacterium]|nr:cysteine synthase A [Clostridia bacterium]
MRIYDSISQLIGNTPLVRIVKGGEDGFYADVLVKIEAFNPAASAKDRVAYAMILDAEKKGLLKKGDAIIEPTSGNTGIGLAAVGVPRGYRVILTMPDTMSPERIAILKAYGAEVILTDGKLGMAGAIEKAEALAEELGGAYLPRQFDNPVNVQAHFDTTGPEIFRDTDGTVDCFVAGIGTGGTITGTAKYLKSQKDVYILGVEPASSPLLTKGHAGAHGQQGIGSNFVPSILDLSLIDEIVCITEEEAYSAARALCANHGIMAGITSGAAVHAAICKAKDPAWAGKCIVALLPDTGMRYLSTPMFQFD